MKKYEVCSHKIPSNVSGGLVLLLVTLPVVCFSLLLLLSNTPYVHQDEEAMEFSALAKAFGNTAEVCRCILKSEILKVS